MQTKRKMPSKKQIFNYWVDKILDLEDCDLNTCWGCGFNSTIERCHINDRCKSNNDNLDNLVLLCKYCHRIQETMCKTDEGKNIFISKLIQGNFLFKLRFKLLTEIYNSGIYNNLNLKSNAGYL
jgi:hypothetical protein